MSSSIKPTRWLLVIAVPLGLAVTAIAWTAGTVNSCTSHFTQDTIPASRHKITRDTDKKEPREKDMEKELQQLDNAMEQLDGKFETIDWGKMQREIEMAMKNVQNEINHHQLDIEKIQRQVQESMKNIDFAKIEKEAQESMESVRDNVDLSRIQEDVQESLKNVKEELNSEAFRKSIEAASKIDMSKITHEIENARKEVEENKVNVQHEMENARKEIGKAKDELKSYREMLDAMEKDGLINTKEDYRVEFDEGQLYINHQKQPQDVLNKYRKYFKEDGIKIYKKNGRFNISID